MTDTVNVPREKLEEVRGVLAERIQGSPARSPAHNARVLIDTMLEAAPKAEPVKDWDAIRSHPCYGEHQAGCDCSAPEAPKVDQEPVAWRGRFTEGVGMPSFYKSEDDLPHDVMDEDAINRWRHMAKIENGHEMAANWNSVRRFVALIDRIRFYTHPAPASDELLEALEAIREIAGARATEGFNERGRLKRIEERATQAIAKHKGPQS